MNQRMKDKGIVYQCKDNDVILKFYFEDNKLDEIHVKLEHETSATVVGYKDLLRGIKKAKKIFNEQRTS